ncbi:RNA polymerase II transcription factor B subunit 4 [Xanthoria calcicola]
MDKLDGSDHYSKPSDEPPISLLTIILDTHPTAWALLSPTLPFSTFLAHLLVFINAHLACNNSNQICLIAAHPHRAEFLYPSPSPSPSPSPAAGAPNSEKENGHPPEQQQQQQQQSEPISEANHYRPFLSLQQTLLASLTALLTNHSPPPPTTTTPSIALSGALTLALTHHNRLASSLSTTPSSSSTTTTNNPNPTTTTTSALNSRILLISLTGSLSAQYIPLTNTIFACQRLQIPISVAKIAGDAAFLEQASDSTRGTYLNIKHPRGMLQYLMMAFLSEPLSNGSVGGGGGSGRSGGGGDMGEGGGGGSILRHVGESGVDFRAACFCHRRVVERGWVCSVCLSIFCSPPSDAICLTCGTQLKLGNYGQKPAVVARKKKRRRNRLDGANGGDPGSGTATPIP